MVDFVAKKHGREFERKGDRRVSDMLYGVDDPDVGFLTFSVKDGEDAYHVIKKEKIYVLNKMKEKLNNEILIINNKIKRLEMELIEDD